MASLSLYTYLTFPFVGRAAAMGLHAGEGALRLALVLVVPNLFCDLTPFPDQPWFAGFACLTLPLCFFNFQKTAWLQYVKHDRIILFSLF